MTFLPGQQTGRGLLGNALDSPLLNLGIGLLAASGPSTVPINLGQALGQGFQTAQSGQQMALRNQLVRSRIEDGARKRSASDKLQGLLGQNGKEGGMLGLLARIAPEQFAQSMIAQKFPAQRAETSLVRNLKSAGIDPASEEGQKIIRDNLGGQGTNEQLDQLLKGLQIKGLQRDQAKDVTETSAEQARKEGATIGSVGSLTGLAEIIPRINLATLASDPRRSVADIQRFTQLSSQEAIDSALRRLSKSGGLTNAKLRAITATKPHILNLPEVNADIVADKLEELLRGADKVGVGVGDRGKIEQTIKKMRVFATQARGEKKGPRKLTGRKKTPRVIDFNSLPE